MIFNSGFGAIEYYKRENYNILFSIFLTFSASAGSLIGANIVLQFDEVLLKYFISVLMLLMGCIIFFKKELGLKRKRNRLKKRKYTIFVLLSFILGVYGGFYGAGVSTLFSFMFVSFLGISFLNSAGTTRLIVTGLSTIAALVFFLNNMINFLYGLILALSFIIGAKIGVRLAFEAGNMWIRRFMIILVIISSIKLIFF
jgi:uncharacterized membrane protein YfcA